MGISKVQRMNLTDTLLRFCMTNVMSKTSAMIPRICENEIFLRENRDIEKIIFHTIDFFAKNASPKICFFKIFLYNSAVL